MTRRPFAGTPEIYTDGASRGNPGPAAYAFLIVGEGEVITEESAVIGIATNNVAEYCAIIAAMQRAKETGYTSVVVYSDSELVVRQVTGRYRITKPHLAELRARLALLEPCFSSVRFRNVPRTNPFIRRCDALCADALGGEASLHDWRSDNTVGDHPRG